MEHRTMECPFLESGGIEGAISASGVVCGAAGATISKVEWQKKEGQRGQ